MQANLRNEHLDTFLRAVWFSYSAVIMLGANVVFILRGDTRRYLVSLVLVLSAGLLVHYLLPTEPPWMAVEGVLRVEGEQYTSMDKNLTAAMPSIHQAVASLFGCALWKYRTYGRFLALAYTVAMSAAIVYLGEHYFVDSIAGVALALGSWVSAKRVLRVFQARL